LKEVVIAVLGLLSSNLHCLEGDQNEEYDNDGGVERQDVSHELARLLQRLELVFAAELGDPLRVFGVVLLVYSFKLSNVSVHVEDQLDCVVDHDGDEYHDEAEVHHEGLEAEGAAHVGEVVSLPLLLHSDDGYLPKD